MKKIFPILLVVLVVAAFVVVPAFAQGEVPSDKGGFDMAYIFQLLQALILATVPVLAGMGVRWIAAKVNAEKLKLNTEQLWALDMFIKTAVYAAEQMKAKEFINDKLNYVTAIAQAWLDERKIALDAFELRARIEAAVKQEFNSEPKGLPAG
jgi:hypothetical protein